MHNILYVEKTSKSPFVSERERVRTFIHKTQDQVAKALKKDFTVRYQYDFGKWTVDQLKDGFQGLITHFPPDNSLFKTGELNGLTGELFFRAYYGGSIEAMKLVRREFPKLAIVVYTGASTSDSNGQVSEHMNKLIIEAGANRIVYRSDNLAEDARAIKRNLVELLA